MVQWQDVVGMVNEPLSSRKCKEFAGLLGNYKILKEVSESWSQLTRA
jgi:hypothetical protein